jgi:hypothetical protein
VAKFFPNSISGQIKDEWNRCCLSGCYAILDTQQLPSGYIPPTLRPKVAKVAVMNFGNTVVVDCVRYDKGMIDHQPGILLFPDNGPPMSGGWLQHADFPDRTVPPSDELKNEIAASGLMTSPPFSGFPTKQCGPLSELNQVFVDAGYHVAKYVSGWVQ